MFTVLLLTTSYGRAFQVVVMLMDNKGCTTDVLNRFTIIFFALFQVISLKSLSKRPTGQTLLNLFRYLSTSISCPRSLLLHKANDLQILEPLLVAMVSELGNHFCSLSLYSFHFINVST